MKLPFDDGFATVRRMTRLRGWATALLAGLLVFGSAAGAAEHSADDTIWTRISSGMRMVDPEHPEVVQWARHYATHPLQLSRMLERSEPFLWYIVEAVELRDMPLEIALLPAVESGFDARATSQREAGGLWQFVPTTSRALGLTHGANYDARSDAVASTRAALTYLYNLHDSFDNWLLALAAYNVGRGKLRQALREAGSRSFWDLQLPRETREHVPRLLGLALLIQDPARFGVTLPAIPNRQAGRTLPLAQPVDLRSAAESAGISVERLRQYNPGLRHLRDTHGKDFVLVAEQDADALAAALASGHFPPQPPANRKVVVVAPGDSLWHIARRHKVSVSALCAWNRIEPSAVLRPGRKLLIEI